MVDRWLASPLSPRGSCAARAAAICLIVLIVVPFTAPFATCDPSSLDAGHVQMQTKDPAAFDLAHTVPAASERLLSGTAAIVPSHVSRAARRQPHEHLVLRV